MRKGKRKIYHIFLNNDDDWTYDGYSDHVVIAYSEEEARKLCPRGDECYPRENNVWLDSQQTACVEIGTAHNQENPSFVVCSSFHAG